MKHWTIGSVRKELKWADPVSVYDSEKPTEGDCTVDGHTFMVQSADSPAMNTGRDRWAVHCKTCGEEIHSATTSAAAQIAMHLNAHAFDEINND